MRIIAYLLIVILAICLCILIGSCSPPDNGLKPLPWDQPTRLQERNGGWEIVGEQDGCVLYAKWIVRDGHGAFVFWSICNDQVNTTTSVSAK